MYERSNKRLCVEKQRSNDSKEPQIKNRTGRLPVELLGEFMNSNLEFSITAKIVEYTIPPVKDMLVLGKESPVGCIAMRRALELLVVSPYEHIELTGDEVISDILVRKQLLRRLPQNALIDFVLKQIKPLLGREEILHVALDVEVLIKNKHPA